MWPVDSGLDGIRCKVCQRGAHTPPDHSPAARCLLEMRLLDLNPDLLIPDLLVRGEGQNNLPGTTSTVAPCMCHNILKTEEIKEKKTIYILADGNCFWGSWHRLGLWDPGISVCLRGAECSFFERTREVGSRQCLLVAVRVGGEPLVLGKTSWGPTEASLSLDQLTHKMGPVSSYRWRESLWLFWPLVSASYRGYNLVGFIEKNLFFLFYFFLSLIP